MNRHSWAVPNATGTHAADAASSPSGIGQVVIAGNGPLGGVRARHVQGHDPVADRAVLDAGADLDDRARGEVADDVRDRRRRRAGAGQQVAALDADRLDVDQDAAVGALRITSS